MPTDPALWARYSTLIPGTRTWGHPCPCRAVAQRVAAGSDRDSSLLPGIWRRPPSGAPPGCRHGPPTPPALNHPAAAAPRGMAAVMRCVHKTATPRGADPRLAAVPRCVHKAATPRGADPRLAAVPCCVHKAATLRGAELRTGCGGRPGGAKSKTSPNR